MSEGHEFQKLETIARFGKVCQQEFRRENPEVLQADAYEALKFFFDFAFFRGRSDPLSEAYRQCAVAAMDDNILAEADELLTPADKVRYLCEHDEAVIARFKGKVKARPTIQGKQYRVNNKDLELLRSTFQFVEGLPHRNLVRFALEKLKEVGIEHVYKSLTSIKQVGDKIACLFLRDVVWLFKVKLKDDNDYYYLQPVDTWVKQVMSHLFPELLNEKSPSDQVKQVIVGKCKEYHVSPIEFNQGLWLIGAHALRILLEHLDEIKPKDSYGLKAMNPE